MVMIVHWGHSHVWDEDDILGVGTGYIVNPVPWKFDHLLTVEVAVAS
jgi:hypothetical protein